MRTSVSNLAWGAGFSGEIAETLLECGVRGVELAPTAIWPDAPRVNRSAVVAEASAWRAAGLPVAAVQSLLYGHPELRLFDPATHADLREHLAAVVRLAGALGAGVAVFGSPRNRVRGDLPTAEADERAAAFFGSFEPVLAGEGVVLTLEPNAPAYGADYLTTYEDCAGLAELIGSRWIAPQIDTGCLAMVDLDPARAVGRRVPAHVHASAAYLAEPPGGIDHEALAAALRAAGYPGWVTLEMRRPDSPTALRRAAAWLVGCYGDTDE